MPQWKDVEAMKPEQAVYLVSQMLHFCNPRFRFLRSIQALMPYSDSGRVSFFVARNREENATRTTSALLERSLIIEHL